MCSGLMVRSPPTTSRMSALSLSWILGLMAIWYRANRSVLAVLRRKRNHKGSKYLIHVKRNINIIFTAYSVDPCSKEVHYIVHHLSGAPAGVLQQE